MRLFHLILGILALGSIPSYAAQETIKLEAYNPEKDTVEVSTKEIASDFKKKIPGKCTVMNAVGDTLFTVYYNREGKPLAKFSAVSKKTGGWKKFYYQADGTYYEEYRPPRRKKEGKDYMRYGSYSLDKTPGLADPLRIGTIYHNTTDCLDKYGNWNYGWMDNGDGKEPILRSLSYHGITLSKKEYQSVVNWGESLMGTVMEIGTDGDGGENPLGIELVPVMNTVKKWLLYFLWAIGLLLVFFYPRLYSWFDRRAVSDITPSEGRFGKEQLVGVIPALMIATPYVLYYESMGEREAFYTLCFFLGAIVVCALFIFLTPKHYIFGRRPAFWKQIFATVTVASALSLVVPFIVLFIVFCFLAGGASSSSSSSSRSSSSDSHEDEGPDSVYAGGSGNGRELFKLSGNDYMDSNGNHYHRDGDTYTKMGCGDNDNDDNFLYGH